MSANPRPPPVTGYPAPPPLYSTASTTTTTTNGYPYAAPYTSAANRYYDPYAVPVPAPAPTPAAGRSAFLRSFVATLLALFLISGAIMFIFWVVLRPRVPSFYVTSLSASNYSVTAASSTSVTATWLLTLRAVNPNKKIRISYDEIESSIAYRDELLATASVPPFYQGTRNTTDVRVGFVDKDNYVSPKTAKGMESDRTAHGSVAIDVRVRALARLKARSWWWARTRIIRVICSEIPLTFTGNVTGGSGLSGQLNGGERECVVLI